MQAQSRTFSIYCRRKVEDLSSFILSRIALNSPAGSGTFPTFVSVTLIDLLGLITLMIVIFGTLWKYLQWKRSSPPRFFASVKTVLGSGGLIRAFFSELWNRVFLQKDVIQNDRARRFAHLTMFWGFAGLGATSILEYVFNPKGNYIPLFENNLSGIRLLGNVAGVVMMIGVIIAVVRLVAIPKYRTNRKFGDIWFTCLLFLAGLTGFITEYFGQVAYATNPNALPAAAYSLSLSASLLILIPYGFHLAVIGLLFLTAPVSFFMHVFQVPSMRCAEKLGAMVSLKSKRIQKNQLLNSKESAMLDQVEELYEKKQLVSDNQA